MGKRLSGDFKTGAGSGKAAGSGGRNTGNDQNFSGQKPRSTPSFRQPEQGTTSPAGQAPTVGGGAVVRFQPSDPRLTGQVSNQAPHQASMSEAEKGELPSKSTGVPPLIFQSSDPCIHTDAGRAAGPEKYAGGLMPSQAPGFPAPPYKVA